MFSNLKTAMSREGITMDTIAETINVHRNTVSNKINGETPFYYEEVIQIHGRHFPYYDQAWLFKRFNALPPTG